MRIQTFNAAGGDTSLLMQQLHTQVAQAIPSPDFVFAAMDSRHDAATVQAALAGLSAGAAGPAIHGASSCLGAMTQHGDHTQEEGAIALFVLEDLEGDYGTHYQPLDDTPRAAAQTATRQALAHAGRAGEIPDVVWVTGTPGTEEDLLAGIADIVGPDVPIIGGSAADNDVSGNWYVLGPNGHGDAGVVVSVLFSSTEVSFAYQNGYAPTAHSGTVTRVEGRRLFEIDGRPALEAYAEWTDGAVCQPQLSAPHNILSASALYPLGRKGSDLHGISTFLLAHPAIANSDGSIDLFASLNQGETLTQMNGTVTALAERAGRVARQALPDSETPIAGALMIYCGGCMLSIRDKLDLVLDGTTTALNNAPFLTHFSFGEQGPIHQSGNRHGNLMISCLVFSAD